MNPLASASAQAVTTAPPALNIPAAGTAGTLLLLTIEAGAAPTDPAGWTLLQALGPTTSNARLRVYSRVAASGDAGSSIPLGATVTRWAVGVSVWPVGTTVVASAAGALTTGTSIVAPDVTPTGTGQELVSVYGGIGGTTGTAITLTPPASQSGGSVYQIATNTTDTTIRNVAQLVAHETLSGSGAAGTRTATSSLSLQQTTASVVLSGSTTPQAPTVDVGADRTVTVNSAVTVTATASDPDGTIASYSWSQSPAATVTLTGATTNQVQFTAPATAGSVQLTCTVTDNSGLTASDTMTVTWAAAGQRLFPAADVVTTSLTKVPSSAPNYFSLIDEATLNTGGADDYVEFQTGSVYEFSLQPGQPVDPAGTWVPKYTMSFSSGTVSYSYRVTVKQLGVTIHQETVTTGLSTTPTQKTITLSAGEVAAIPDPTQPIVFRLDNITAA